MKSHPCGDQCTNCGRCAACGNCTSYAACDGCDAYKKEG